MIDLIYCKKGAEVNLKKRRLYKIKDFNKLSALHFHTPNSCVLNSFLHAVVAQQSRLCNSEHKVIGLTGLSEYHCSFIFHMQSPLKSLSGSGWIQSLPREPWAWDGNTTWMGCQGIMHTHIHTCVHIKGNLA